MKISKLALIALLGGALMAFGCSDSNGSGGTGGDGGATGEGGGGGAGPIVDCVENEGDTCGNSDIDPIVPCCELPAPPDVADACNGDESLLNPETCDTTDAEVVIHQLTQLEIDGDCNSGYDLDSCDGTTCTPGGLTPAEGVAGVDNALAALGPALVDFDGNLGGVNQAFNDALCGLEDGDEDEEECNDPQPVTPLDLGFAVAANPDANCANVGLLVDGEEAGTVILNVSDANDDGNVCASGTIGTLPLEIGGEAGSMGNVVVRLTISEGGFSNGVMGATVDAATAVAIANALLEGAGGIVGSTFDINEVLEGNVANQCNALSGSYAIGGVVAQPE